MAEGVVLADRDHGQPRAGAVEEVCEARVVAAMVGDLEDVDRPRVERDRLRLGVGSQQDREVVPAGDGDDRELVRVGAGMAAAEQLRRRPQDLEMEGAGADQRPRRQPAGAGPRGAGEGEGVTAENGIEDAFDRDGRQDLVLGAVVVGLVVGQDQGSEALNPRIVELGGDPVTGGPGVDQDRQGAGGLEQDRVALADVEHRDPEAGNRGGPPGTAAGPDQEPDQAAGDKGGERRPPPAAGAAARPQLSAPTNGRDPAAPADPLGEDRAQPDRDVGADQAADADSDFEVGPARAPAPGGNLGDVCEQRRLERVDRRDGQTGHLADGGREHPQPHRRRDRGKRQEVGEEGRRRDRAEAVGDQRRRGQRRGDGQSSALSKRLRRAPRPDSGDDRPPQRSGQQEDADDRGKAQLPADVGRDPRFDRDGHDCRHREPVEAGGAAPGERRQDRDRPHHRGPLDRGAGAGQRDVDRDQRQDPDQPRPQRDPEAAENRHRQQSE